MNELICKGLLFDLDGVLVDSIECVNRVWRSWAIEKGFDPEKVLATAHGRRSLETIRILAPELDAETENLIVERREIEDTEGLVVIEGAAALLSSLPLDRWAIVTSGTRPLATRRLQVAGLPVPEKMVTANEVNNGKPHPEPYLKGAKLLGLDPKDCVVVEDAPAGIKAGKAAGMRVLGIVATHPRSELAEATVLIDTLNLIKAETMPNGDLRLRW